MSDVQTAPPVARSGPPTPRPPVVTGAPLTPLQQADAHEAKRTPVQAMESLVEEAGRRLHSGGAFTYPFVQVLRAVLDHMRGSHEVADTATFDGAVWIVTRPGLHSVTVPATSGMTIEQAIAAAQPELDAYEATAHGVDPTPDTATLTAGPPPVWVVRRPGPNGGAVVVPAKPDMSAEAAIEAAQAKLDAHEAAVVAARAKGEEAPVLAESAHA